MFFSIGHLEKLLFTREFSILLKSGVPLGEALESLKNKTHQGTVRTVIQSVLDDINNGQSLAHALSRFPKTFDHLYISLIQIGETSGTLKENLEFLAHQLDKAYALRKKIQAILLYPSIVLTMTFGLGAAMSIFILPKLIRLFESFQVTLPFSTRVLLWLASFMQTYGIAFFVSVFLGIVLWRTLVSLARVKPYWHLFLLKIPVIGAFFQNVAIAHFCRDMGVMLRSGSPLLEALHTEERVIENRAMVRMIRGLSSAVAQGTSLSEELERKQYSLIPSLAVKMIAAGERTGKLDETFLYLEQFFETEVDREVKNMTVLFEPVLLVIIGAVVCFLALAILMPIYSLTGSVHR